MSCCPLGLPQLPIIDARSGQLVRLGETIRYPGVVIDGTTGKVIEEKPDHWTLLGYCDRGGPVAHALIEGTDRPRQWVAMPVHKIRIPPPVGVRFLAPIPQTIRYAIFPS